MAGQTPQSFPRRRKSAFNDPVVLTLAILIAAIVISGLLFFAVSLGMGYVGGKAPQTASEAALIERKNLRETNKDEPRSWYEYAKSLAGEKQFAQAQALIKDGAEVFKETDDYDFYMLCAQAHLYFQQRDYKKCIEQIEIAQKKMTEAYEAEAASDKSPNRAKAYGISENYDEMTLLAASAHRELGEHEKEVELFEGFLEKFPREAGVWIDLGHAYAKLGNKEKAIAAYDEALSFIADNEEALEAKAKLGAE